MGCAAVEERTSNGSRSVKAACGELEDSGDSVPAHSRRRGIVTNQALLSCPDAFVALLLLQA